MFLIRFNRVCLAGYQSDTGDREVAVLHYLDEKVIQRMALVCGDVSQIWTKGSSLRHTGENEVYVGKFCCTDIMSQWAFLHRDSYCVV